MSLKEGIGVGFRGVVGGAGFPLEKNGKRGRGTRWVGGGVGTGKGTGKSMRKLCRNYPLATYLSVSPLKKLRKIRAPIKIKSALPPPPPKPKIPPPPKTRNFMDRGFSCRTDAFFPGVHKIGAALSGPRIADKEFYGHGDFSKKNGSDGSGFRFRFASCAILPCGLHWPCGAFGQKSESV